LGTEDSNFLANFSAISAYSTSSFQVWVLTVPCEPPPGQESYAYMSGATWAKVILLAT